MLPAPRRAVTLAGLLTTALALAACSSTADVGGDSAASPVASGSVAGSSRDAPSGSDSANADGAVPDPCELLSVADTIEPILGFDPGTPEVNTQNPEVRKVCLYTAGLFLEVEIAANYEQSVAAIKDPATGATTQDLAGVGEKALLSDYGEGINQVVALAGDYYVGVTGVMSPEQASELASAMVDAIS